MAKIVIKNLAELQAVFERAPARLVQSAGTAVQKSILVIESNAKREAPVNMGSLRQSIRSQMIGPASGMVEVGVKYAPYVEYGTRPHVIRAKRAKVLASTKGGVTRFFGKTVNHPGTAANPFLSRAVDSAQPQVDVYFEQAVREALT